MPQFLLHALGGDFPKGGGGGAEGLPGGGFDAQVELGGQTDGPQQAQRVVGEGAG